MQKLCAVILAVTMILIFGANIQYAHADAMAGSTMPTAVPSSPQDTHPILTGKVPTGLQLITVDGKSFSLDSAIVAHPTILIFYRGGWCPFCNMHLGALETIAPQLQALGYQILAISPDPGPKLQETIDKHTLTYTLLSDPQMSASKALGVAYRVDPDMLGHLKGFGVDLETRDGLHPPMLPVPAAYVLDTSGNIKFAYANPDYKVRVDTQVLLKAAKDAVGQK